MFHYSFWLVYAPIASFTATWGFFIAFSAIVSAPLTISTFIKFFYL